MFFKDSYCFFNNIIKNRIFFKNNYGAVQYGLNGLRKAEPEVNYFLHKSVANHM